MTKLIRKQDIKTYKLQISKVFGCVEFDPKDCCLCSEANRLVDEMSHKQHNPDICGN